MYQVNRAHETATPQQLGIDKKPWMPKFDKVEVERQQQDAYTRGPSRSVPLVWPKETA